MKKNIIKLMILVTLASGYQTKGNMIYEIANSPIIGGLIFAGAHIACDYFTTKPSSVKKKTTIRPRNWREYIKNSHRQWRKANKYREGHKHQIYSGGWFSFGSDTNKKLGEMGKNRMNENKRDIFKNMSPEL